MRNFVFGVLAGVAATVVVGLIWLSTMSGVGTEHATPPLPPAPGDVASAPKDLQENESWYGEVSLSSAMLAIGQGGELRDVRAVGRGVRVSPGRMKANRITVDAKLPFAAAATQVGGGVQLYPVGGGRIGVKRVAEFLGQKVTVSSEGMVKAEGGQLVFEPEKVGFGDNPGASITPALRQLVTIHHTIEGLPEGARLNRVSTSQDGFDVSLEGANVVMGAK